jgi:group I intron endonuclease
MQKGLLYNNSLHICTDGFVYAEIQRLTQYIKHRFNIKCTIHKKAGGNFHIYILAKSVDLVKNLILPYELNIISASASGTCVYPPTVGFPPYSSHEKNYKKKGKQGQKKHKFDNKVPFRSPFLLNTRPVVNLLESSISLRKFYSTKYNPDPVVPILKYDNADLSKKKAVKENKGRSGVYRWKNNITGKCYVGSSVFLGRRLINYFSFEYIADPKRNMLINKALIKYGYSNFSLDILEYCEPCLVVTREQYYIDLLKPEYNILKVAGSSWGYKHTEVSRSKMRGKKSPEHLEKVISNLKKINLEGFSPEVRARITKGTVDFNIKTKGKKVVFTNIETPEVLTFVSIRDAALKLDISRRQINKYILSKEP